MGRPPQFNWVNLQRTQIRVWGRMRFETQQLNWRVVTIQRAFWVFRVVVEIRAVGAVAMGGLTLLFTHQVRAFSNTIFSDQNLYLFRERESESLFGLAFLPYSDIVMVLIVRTLLTIY